MAFKTIVGGSIDFKVGTTPIHLTTDDLDKTPKEFKLPNPVSLKLADLNSWLTTNFTFPTISFLSDKSLDIDTFEISSEGSLEIDAAFVLGTGYQLFSGFTVDKISLGAKRILVANPPTLDPTTPLTPTSGKVGTMIAIKGTNLAYVSQITIGTVVLTNLKVIDDTAVQATIPPGAVTGAITVTNPAGNAASTPTFTVTP